MLHKYIALGIFWSMTFLSVIPAANASYSQGYYDEQNMDLKNYMDGNTSYYDRNSNPRQEHRNQKYHTPKHHSQKYYGQKYHNRKTSSNTTSESTTSEQTPFPSKISSSNLIKVDLNKRAWGAYDDEGNLVKWGRASGGKNFCPDIHRGCKTVTGTFTIFDKKGPECKSSRFPLPHGGAPMPYCMHFKGGYALHGGNVPNYNASHGCVRLPVEDAQWLNQNFVKVGSTRVNIHY